MPEVDMHAVNDLLSGWHALYESAIDADMQNM